MHKYQQEKDLVFHDLDQDKTPLPSLSLIWALHQLVKELWDKPPLALQVPYRVEHHYKIHGTELGFLAKHPNPNSIVVKSTQYRSRTRSVMTPMNREVCKTDSLGRKLLLAVTN